MISFDIQFEAVFICEYINIAVNDIQRKADYVEFELFKGVYYAGRCRTVHLPA